MIQMRVRRRAAQMRVKHVRKQRMRKMRQDACLLIQSIFRGFWQRTRVAGPIRNEFLAMKRQRLRQASAVLIEARVRGWLARTHFRIRIASRENAAIVAQHFWRRVSAARDAKKEMEQRIAVVVARVNAAQQIQRFVKQCLSNARQRQMQVMHKSQVLSATAIQSFCRSVFAKRDLFFRRIRFAQRRQKAAMRIQICFRAAIDRSHARAMAQIARRELLYKRRLDVEGPKAASKIQRWIRACQSNFVAKLLRHRRLWWVHL